MRYSALTGLLLGGVLLASGAIAEAAPRTKSLPPAAKISFPTQAGAFKRQGPPQRDPFGYPTATYWAGALAMASVFYYPNEGQSLARGHGAAREHVKLASPSAKLRSDRAEQILLGGAKRAGHRAVFTLTGPGNMPAKSQLITFSRGDYFLKFRITYPLPHAERADKEIDRFLANFPWPGG
jgi:hypothetical protein